REPRPRRAADGARRGDRPRSAPRRGGGLQGGRARPAGGRAPRRGRGRASDDEGAAVRVALCAYGAGNVRSVELALRRLGAEPALAERPEEVRDADLAVLPGVGAAAAAMAGLRARGLDGALWDRARERRPILG